MPTSCAAARPSSPPVIQREDLLVTLGSETYAVMLTERDLRERYVCTDPPREVTVIS